MCGIIGILGTDGVADELVDGLKRLEYRGYDSAGIATLVNGQIERRRAEGKLKNLAAEVRQSPLSGRKRHRSHTLGPRTASPTLLTLTRIPTAKVAIVHNGIIENFDALRAELSPARDPVGVGHGYTRRLFHLISAALDDGLDPIEAVKSVIGRLHGAFALAILFADHDNLMIGARKGSPPRHRLR